jgi:predicted nucleic acid-binding Zn ribbon protein
MQKITEPALTQCESCEGPVRKILYPVGIAFKGEGFYVNDYKKSSGSSSASKDSGDSKPAADAKPATDTKSSTDTKASTSSTS